MDTKENKTIKFIIISILVIAVISLIGFAFARYITKLNGTTTADIAKWSFKVNGKTNENLSIDLANTRAGIEQEAEVQEGYIGPGTAGRFVIELDATGSDVSLKYDINLNVDYSDNKVFPKNLIFYEDSTMQNAIYHTDNNINLNGFIGWNDGSKVHTKTIYWKWSYETGSTQTEKDNNDIADSYWMGKPITLSMNVTAKQVNENPTSGQYAVTLDANGGTIQGYGNSSHATKMVNYGKTYGNLPTPTREGYTFKGWNGRNLLNINAWLKACKLVYNGTITKEDTSITITSNSSGGGAYTITYYVSTKNYGDSQSLKIPVKSNTTYTLSWKNILNGAPYGQVYAFVNDKDTSGYYFRGTTSSEVGKLTVMCPDDAQYIRFRVDVPVNNANIKYYDIQLEEGTNITEYEPYIISESTPVTQGKNHTLTAIWEPISNP